MSPPADSGDWAQSPEWIEYAKRVIDELVPMIDSSRASISLVPDGETDVKFAVELGLSIMLDKPIIAVVVPGTKVPAKLVQVADVIVEGDMGDPGMQRRLMDAVREVLGRVDGQTA